MGERPVSETADALSELPGLAAREADAVAGEAQEQARRISGIVRAGGRDARLSGLADEIEALSAQMHKAFADLPGQITKVVDVEVAQLRGLLAPAGSGVPPGGVGPTKGVSGLDGVATFGAPGAGAESPSPRVVKFATEAEFNAAVDEPQQDTTYRYRDVEWRTDELGRTVSVIGTPRLEPATRDPKLQAQIGHEGRDTDVGFHLLGHALGGPTNRVNVVSGNGRRIEDGLANLNQGAYKKFENEVRKHLKAGHDVKVEIRVAYNPANTTRRPDEFVARLTVDGERSRPYRFANK